MTRYSWLFLALLPLFAGCPKRPDYGGVQQDAHKAQQSLDNQQP